MTSQYTSVFVLQDSMCSQPFKRKSRPKVRTGCIMCKTRRIKCDEKKPSCDKCVKSGRGCEYPVSRPSRKECSPMVKPNQPLSSRASSKPQSEIAIKSELYNSYPLPGPVFQSQQEYQCFQLFCEKTVFALAGNEEPEVWGRLVLQACERQESIKTAVIAIGALDHTLEAAQDSQRRTSHDISTVEAHVVPYHLFALQQYGKAIKTLREDLLCGKHDLRTTVISCLLIVAFELFQGNHTSALTQASMGLNLIVDRMKELRKAASSSERSETQLLNTVDEVLIQKFARLDLSSMGFADENVIRNHLSSMPPETFLDLKQIPTSFKDLNEAQSHWEISLMPIMNFMKVAKSWEYGEDTSSEDHCRKIHVGDAEWNRIKATTVTELRIGKNIGSDDVRDDNDIHEIHMNLLLQRILAWGMAFEPQFLYSRTPEGRTGFVRATLLQIRSKSALITASISPNAGELQYDKHIHTFREIVGLVKQISSHNATLPTFTFEMGRVVSLYFVVTRCRDCVLRREAVSLLLSTPIREGVWDNVVAARFATVVMLLEEVGLQDGFIPESSRVRVESVSFDLRRNRGRMRYSRGKWRPPEQREVESVEVTW